MKKTHIIITGGTVLAIGEDKVCAVKKESDIKRWLNMMPELELMAPNLQFSTHWPHKLQVVKSKI